MASRLLACQAMSSSLWVGRLVMACSVLLYLDACDSQPPLELAPGDAGIADDGDTATEPPLATLPERVDLGAGDCGHAASTSFELRNRGGAALTYAFVTSDPQVTVSPSTGTVATGAAVAVHVTAEIPARIAARETLTATLTATTNARDAGTRSIPVSFRSRGAEIVIDRSVIGMGESAVGFVSTQPFLVRNTGDAAATVTISPPGGEFRTQLGASSTVTLDPGATMPGEVSYLPRDLGVDTGTASVIIGGATCGEVPRTLSLSGEGVVGDGVMVQGGPIDFGAVACGFPAPATRIRLMNPAAIDARFTATFLTDAEHDERFFTVSPSAGSVPAHGTIELLVIASAIRAPASPRVYDAVLRITTRLGVDVVHDVPVRQTLHAPELQISSAHNFGVIPVGSTQGIPVTITNRGNASATLVATATSPFRVVMPIPIAGGGGVGTGTIFYTPQTSVPVTGMVTVTANLACAAPLQIPVEAGRGPFAVLEATSVTATCPPPPSLSTQLQISNLGNEPLDIICHELGNSGLALQFPLLLPEGFHVPAHGAADLPITLAPGPLQFSWMRAVVECFDNEPVTGSRLTTVTRTLVEDGAPCSDPGGSP